MDRLKFLQSLALLPLAGAAMNLKHLHKATEPFEVTDKMPVLFLGHGSPMNAIQETEFSQGWRNLGKSLPRPNAIICISAHWETKGTYVTAMEKPKTIHDFGGFPQELFDVQYPAPGSPAIAMETKNTITKTEVGLDQQWGLDHGCWSVVKHLYPDGSVYEFEKERFEFERNNLQSENYHARMTFVSLIQPQLENWQKISNLERKRLLRLVLEVAYVRGNALAAIQPSSAFLPTGKRKERTSPRWKNLRPSMTSADFRRNYLMCNILHPVVLQSPWRLKI